MRILALTWKHPQDKTAGGAERYLLEVTRRWADAGHAVTIFGPRKPGTYGSQGGAEMERLAYVGQGSRWTVFRAAQAYLRAQGHQYDHVLETVSTRPFAAHSVVGDKSLALYYQTAEDVWQLEFPRPMAFLGRHILEPNWIRRMRGARVAAISPSTVAALARFRVASQATVPPGCDLPSARPGRSRPNRPPRLLWIGRLVRTKRPSDAVSAFELIRKEMPGASLDLVGRGYLETELRSHVGAAVTIHGYLDETVKGRLLAQADLLLLPGTREGWGIVAMEAAAYGVPVVAYDVPGLRDAVVDEVTGIVVSSTPESLAAAAVRVLEDVHVWRRQSAAGMAWARSHTWDETAKSLLSVLCPGGAQKGADGTENVGARGALDHRHNHTLAQRSNR